METITSVTEYLELIKGLEIKNNVFFRGHADYSYNLNPGIYREIKDKENKTLIDYEDQIYREVISKSPQEFLGKTTLESLALLQHYEAPTRVLDLTENALIALFFAVNKGENDGEVIVFDIPDHFVCHYNSDKVTILANIAKCERDFKYKEDLIRILQLKISEIKAKSLSTPSLNFPLFINIYSFFDKNFEKLRNVYKDDDEFELKNYDANLQSFKKEFELKYGKLIDDDFIKFEVEFKNNLLKILNMAIDENIKNCNQNFFGKLIHNIREDKSYFDGIIDPRHLSQVFAVRPKLDNPRITRQQGAFLIFGVEQSNGFVSDKVKPIANLNEDWVVRGLNKERIVIDKDCKKSIMNELEQLGINQSILFPEVDKVADFVRRKYQNKLN
jgi:hypothetical protein